MTQQVESAPKLVSLLNRHRVEIAAAWAEMVQQLPGSHYGARPLEELRASTMRGLGTIIETLDTGSYTAMETYLTDVSLTRLRMGFDISEVIEALLLCRDAALPAIWKAYPPGSSEAREAIAHLDDCLRHMIGRFGHLHADAMHNSLEEQQRRTALMLETARAASSSLELDEVLRLVAGSMAAAVGVRHCGIYLMDDESGRLFPTAGRADPQSLGPGFDRAYLSRPLDPTRDAFTRQVLEEQEPVVCYDAQTDPRTDREMAQRLGLKSILAVPFVVRGRVVAVAMVSTFEHHYHFTPEQIELARGIASAAAMAIENARLYQREQDRLAETERRRQVAEGLRDILTILNSNRPLDEILEYIVAQARRLLASDTCAVYRLREEDMLFEVQASDGLGADLAALQMPAANMVTRRRQPVSFPDLKAALVDSGHLQHPSLSLEQKALLTSLVERYGAQLIVPLIVKEEVYGGIVFCYHEPRAFSDEEIELAATFGDQAALAIENARLYEQAQHAATAEERQRLARELHDAVTQTLFSASLIAEVLPHLWEHNPDEGHRRLAELRELTRGALAEMRTLLLELRPATLTESGLGDLLRQLGEAITGRARVPVSVTVEGKCSLPADVQVALYRIAQEALNNVAKHAGATQATVCLRCAEGEVELRVSDDGRGFNPEDITPNHLGLGIMRERAQAIDAALEIESQPGHGTQVTVVWKETGD